MNLMYELGIIGIFDLLKLDSANCLVMYKKLKISPELLSDLLGATVVKMYDSGLLTDMSIQNINLIFRQLLSDYSMNSNTVVHINKNYYTSQKYLKKVKKDKNYTLLFDDIYKRYFGATGFFSKIKYRQQVEEFYLKNYNQIMEDILFDVYLINYFLKNDFSNELLSESRVTNAIRYLYLSRKELFDDINIKHKIETIFIKIDEGIFKRESIDKLLEKVSKKRKNNRGKLYEQ